ncbi:MAG TPA: ATP-binding protein, partial [Chryseolinea sp.]|nr:ATP-binding protein [Chryseolinea sp.]
RQRNVEDRTRLILVSLVAILAFSFVFSLLLWRSNSSKQRSNIKLESTLKDLHATQSQLIQSEKMASLGELTAGIAHEIQNPLNFVNNFSELNKELLTELVAEVERGNASQAKAIVNDVILNEEKIAHHGKRAESIVKGMLQHSRSSAGIKEPVDLNLLVDEYSRLAYHGLRAKDNTFNATMNVDLDPGLGQVNIIPQDIGRVVLNLVTNAFFAVSEKRKKATAGYEPVVSIKTKRSTGTVEIVVADNGDGVPQVMLDKIFQPFFTTKPSGQGTGLGLSISYDIVKAHGGELKVISGKDLQNGLSGAEFRIVLPA